MIFGKRPNIYMFSSIFNLYEKRTFSKWLSLTFSYRTWNKLPSKEGFIAEISLSDAISKSKIQFIRWKVHRDWVQQVRTLSYHHQKKLPCDVIWRLLKCHCVCEGLVIYNMWLFIPVEVLPWNRSSYILFKSPRNSVSYR